MRSFFQRQTRADSPAPLVLTCLVGMGRGQRIPVHDLVRIGRDPSNQLQLDDDRVSRKHAKVTRIPTGVRVTDLGSANGTLVDGHRICGESRDLAVGGRLRFGNHEFRLEPLASPSAGGPLGSRTTMVLVAGLVLGTIAAPWVMHRERNARSSDLELAESTARQEVLRGDFFGAYTRLEEAQDRNPADQGLAQSARALEQRMAATADSLLRAAREQLERNDTEAAAVTYRTVIDLDPEARVLGQATQVARAGLEHVQREKTAHLQKPARQEPVPRPKRQPRRPPAPRPEVAAPVAEIVVAAVSSPEASSLSGEELEELREKLRRAQALWRDWGPAYPERVRQVRDLLRGILSTENADTAIVDEAQALRNEMETES